ncbi:hypothetical protein HK099_004499 [Clydaea vesicula]|uniref:Uncharacterized protein n=1 Tax=Clydaea vesicula TaxID=447962 RepID=A0AAD5U6Y6_9FUNG|nr:hypothetical protein HK099_004499 [Clydaea vesicula]
MSARNKAIIGLQPIIEYLEDYEVQPTIYPVVKTSKMGVYDTKKKFCLSIQRRLDKFLIMCMKNQEYKKSSIWKKILSKNHLSAEGSFLFPTTYPHLLDLKVLSTFYYLQKMRSLHPTSPTNGPQWFNFETQLNSLLDFMEARDTSFPVIEDDASRVLHQYQLEEDENVAENTNQDFEIGDLVSVYPIGFSGGYSTLKGLESEYFNNLNLSKVEDNCIFSGIFFGENNSSLIKLLVEFKIDDSENTYEAEITFSKTNLLLKKIIT